ncbi:15419_t:CDS:2, partial [Cetraspora pellucida]
VDGKNIQVLPDNLAYLLTPIAIGYWLASDGSYSQRDAVVTIYTDSFSPDEVGLLRGILLERYGILSTRYSNAHVLWEFSNGIGSREDHKLIRDPLSLKAEQATSNSKEQ